MIKCVLGHNWGFPRRWKAYEGKDNVDVETCTDCGARRVSVTQFHGAGKSATAEKAAAAGKVDK